MFRKLLAWLTGYWRKPTGVATDLFLPEERLIYRFFDGYEIRSVDPMVMWRRLMDRWPEISVDIKVGGSASKDATKAQAKGAERVRDLFQVQALDNSGKGLNELEVMGLLNHFLLYCELLKKSMNSPQTSAAVESTRTESPPTEDQPTSKPLESGSIEDEPCSEAPNPSASESPSPSDCKTPELSTIAQ